MTDDVAPTWRTVSEVVMKIVLSNSSLGYHNYSISHPLLHPHADKIILLIKDYIYCKNVFEQSLGLFLLLPQYDLFVLKWQADALYHTADLQLSHLSSFVFSVKAIKLCSFAVALVSCCSFCSIFFHLVD